MAASSSGINERERLWLWQHGGKRNQHAVQRKSNSIGIAAWRSNKRQRRGSNVAKSIGGERINNSIWQTLAKAASASIYQRKQRRSVSRKQCSGGIIARNISIWHRQNVISRRRRDMTSKA